MNTYIKKAAVFFIALVQICCCSKGFNTTLEPLSDVVYVCPGMKITFKCSESTIDLLLWTWQNSDPIRYQHRPNIMQRLNTTEVLSSVDGVTTTLTDFRTNGSLTTYIESTLQFTPSGSFISANVSCNMERRVVKITDCSNTLQILTISRFWNSDSASSICFELKGVKNHTNTIFFEINNENITVPTNSTQKYILNLNRSHFMNFSIEFSIFVCEITCSNWTLTLAILNCTSYTIIYTTILHTPSSSYYNCTEINAYSNTSANCRKIDTEIYCKKENKCDSPSTPTTLFTTDSTNKASTSEATVTLQSSSASILQSSSASTLQLNSASFIPVVIGSSCAVLLLVMATFSIIILILKKSKVNRKDKGQVSFREREENNSKDETEYHRINFGHTRQTQEAEFGEYCTLNSGLNSNGAQRYNIPAQDEEYSTINQPHVVNNTWVRDEYEYTSVKIDNSNDRNTKRKEDSERYAVLESNGEESTIESNDLGRGFNDIKYSKITTTVHPADSLLNLDTVLIQLREIASKWEAMGQFLNFSNETLLLIKTTGNGADFDCLVELFDHWLRCEKSPTWKTIADALKEIGEPKLSYEIFQIYDTGELPDKKQSLHEQDFENGIFQGEEAPPVPPQCF